ncbi:hypothetical protein BJ138DRAFT_115978 [Hygrophoropsis aurantiaca]|uniref:Uncharacterized protein n=1 Tax=Hygrophoropsis aurantiaca TaxID=72124 RepID=A0ACB7ZRW3_9AGAM|nr:hypothetical protein BJ138DRAFT_115978 [Hygrophoropsis aurantiaca]
MYSKIDPRSAMLVVLGLPLVSHRLPTSLSIGNNLDLRRMVLNCIWKSKTSGACLCSTKICSWSQQNMAALASMISGVF